MKMIMGKKSGTDINIKNQAQLECKQFCKNSIYCPQGASLHHFFLTRFHFHSRMAVSKIAIVPKLFIET